MSPHACPACGARPGEPCQWPDGPSEAVHDRRDPVPVDWRARAVRMWREQGRIVMEAERHG